MTEPIWLDENGQRRPTPPCPKCGLPDPILRLRYEHLRANELVRGVDMSAWSDRLGSPVAPIG